MKTPFLTFLLSVSCLSAAQARDWYVSSGVNSGGIAAGVDDTNAAHTYRGDLTHPLLTIQFAADLVQAGDIVNVRQGTYTNQFSFSPGWK